MNLAGKSVISIRDFSKDELDFILETAKKFDKTPQKYDSVLAGKVMAAIFFEPSTRTRLSFESSMLRLGGKVIGFSDSKVTSTVKGETLYDTIKIVEGYSDVIVIRHPQEGAARLAADAAKIPVVNAGDGANQHPTQTMLDMFTIQKKLGRLTGLNIAFLGDLKYGRTVHSLAHALSLYGNSFYFIAPESLQMPRDHIQELEKNGARCESAERPEHLLKDIDLLYVTRIQKERFPDPVEYDKVKGVYKVDREMLSHAKPSIKIMHPLPRVGEIDPEIDSHPGAIWLEQAKNGIPVRRAVLSLVLGGNI